MADRSEPARIMAEWGRIEPEKAQIGFVQSYDVWKGERLRTDKDLQGAEAFTVSQFQEKSEPKGDCE